MPYFDKNGIFRLTESERLARLELPRDEELLDVVIDTDTYNEVDDQFAIAHALLSPERMRVQAIHAAPYHNDRSTGPEDGMERSYDEIQRLLERLGKPDQGDFGKLVFKGSREWMRDRQTPVASDSAENLIKLAMARGVDVPPLYVAAIGAITNVSSAILLEPQIAERICVVWLGGHALYWRNTDEFNLQGDVAAAQVLFDSGVPLVQVPCYPVTSHLLTTLEELDAHVYGRSALGDFLVDRVREYGKGKPVWGKEIWDVAATGWLMNPAWVPSDIVHAPILTDEKTWSFDPTRHFMRSAWRINRDAIFGDLFGKLAAFAK